ncbi:hypothetical protein P152DRAFT_455484 [Eremomyces bilateralis CBS 781.70]|uniref:Uncharacterized protein n=1 Tax=Eremomyces bilateralis CBS 781.70 TaxID=1392243 RepID=A0A6G1GCZ2_9PEZI|nr:uncharacterized protein P152DRAFT_455484 [Eremomyces bilateralis CBS 781.70]KAF1815770.1 hypothetical protein P152DRAFT_455484 [Eremomyces bilateralis CBS 781.70]
MTEKHNGESANASVEADFAQALKELTRGEQTAAALENHLTSLESKIEELLAQSSEDQATAEKEKESKGPDAGSSSGDKNGGP